MTHAASPYLDATLLVCQDCGAGPGRMANQPCYEPGSGRFRREAEAWVEDEMRRRAATAHVKNAARVEPPPHDGLRTGFGGVVGGVWRRR